MKNLFRAFALFATFFFASAAQSATCFWVGGTGTYDLVNTASWASSTGGTGGTCAATGGIPKQTVDIATFDGASGGGVVTVNTNFSIATFTAGAFTGTIDFATNNIAPTVTSQYIWSGAGTRTVNCGPGPFTVSGTNTNGNSWDVTTATGLTMSCASTAIVIGAPTGASTQAFVGGGQSYGSLSVAGRSNGGTFTLSGSNSFGTLGLSGPIDATFANGTTQTVTNALNWVGTSAAAILVHSSTTSVASLAVAVGSTISWGVLRDMNFTGNTVAASNSLNLGGNAGATITPPSAGTSSGHVLGSGQ